MLFFKNGILLAISELNNNNQEMKIHVSLLILLLAYLQLNAQAKKEVKPTLPKELPAIEKVLDYVEANSHAIKEQDALSLHYRQSVKIAEKEWMEKVGLDIGLQRSNNGALLNVNNSVSTEEFNSVSFQNLNSFRFGVTVRLTMFDFIARRNLVKQAQYRLLASEEHSKLLHQDVKFRITELYKDAQLAYKLLSIKADKKYALYLQREMAEKEFQQGQLHISELGRITELTSNAYAEFEEVTSTYEKLYYQLEIMLGISLKDLK
jgi:outer membrane protein TolC